MDAPGASDSGLPVQERDGGVEISSMDCQNLRSRAMMSPSAVIVHLAPAMVEADYAFDAFALRRRNVSRRTEHWKPV